MQLGVPSPIIVSYRFISTNGPINADRGYPHSQNYSSDVVGFLFAASQSHEEVRGINNGKARLLEESGSAGDASEGGLFR